MTASTPEPGRHAAVGPTHTKLANFLERVGWTLLQAASAEGLITAWEATGHTVADSNRALYIVVLTTLLAALKNGVVQTFSPTGSTLPTDTRPVLAENVVTKADDSSSTGVIAWTGASLPNDTPVLAPTESAGA